MRIRQPNPSASYPMRIPSSRRFRFPQLLYLAFASACGLWYLSSSKRHSPDHPVGNLDHSTSSFDSDLDQQKIPVSSDAVKTLSAQFAIGNFNALRDRKRVGVCLTVNNEAKYIDEFLLYHLYSGVDHFYVYDDESTDGLDDILAPYIEGGVVTLKTLRNQTGRPEMFQWNYMRHCFDSHRRDTQWLGHWDVDEFLQFVPQIGLATVPYLTSVGNAWRFPLDDILDLPSMAASLGMAVSRLDFPNVGMDSLPATALISQTHTWRRSYANPFTKSFVHTANKAKLPLSAAGAHGITVVNQTEPIKSETDLFYVDAAGTTFPPDNKQGGYGGQRSLVTNRLVLNHYLQRDLQDCIYKAERRQQSRPVGWRAQQGPASCTTGSTYLPLTGGDSNIAWQRNQLVFDGRVAESYASIGTQAVLRHWNIKGRPSVKGEVDIEIISKAINYYP